jgi:hypothetical protein
MAVTLEELEKRIRALEREMAALRQLLERRPAEKAPAERGARLLREARANQAVISATVARAFAELAITGQPIGAEKVQEMVAACGFRPEDNEFSRGIVAMREE